MTNQEFCKALEETVSRLEADIAHHEKYLAAPPSLEYNHYVAVIKPETWPESSKLVDWTVRLTCYGVTLQKGTTAADFYKFMTKREATIAARKLRLVNNEGVRISHSFEIISCRTWHSRMIEWERKSIEQLKEIISVSKKEVVAA